MPKIDDLAAQTPQATQPRSQIRVGIVGYGTVGRATAQILAAHAEDIRQRTGGVSVTVKHICRRSPKAGETFESGVRVSREWRDVVNDSSLDIIVEAIGGTDAAGQVVRASLENGKAVVTANKALLALQGEELFGLARQKNLPIGIEASVAGGVPVIRAISE